MSERSPLGDSLGTGSFDAGMGFDQLQGVDVQGTFHLGGGSL